MATDLISRLRERAKEDPSAPHWLRRLTQEGAIASMSRASRARLASALATVVDELREEEAVRRNETSYRSEQ